jgi:hypothetical protein
MALLGEAFTIHKGETGHAKNPQDQNNATQEMLHRVDDIISRAENAKQFMLPSFRPPEDDQYPAIHHVKAGLGVLKLDLKRRLGASGKTSEKNSVVKCWACDKEGRLVCSKCKVARFCGVECQHRVWKDHKKDCKALCEKKK